MQEIVAYNPINEPLPLKFASGKLHLLAVRIELPERISSLSYIGVYNVFFKAYIRDWFEAQSLPSDI